MYMMIFFFFLFDFLGKQREKKREKRVLRRRRRRRRRRKLTILEKRKNIISLRDRRSSHNKSKESGCIYIYKLEGEGLEKLKIYLMGNYY